MNGAELLLEKVKGKALTDGERIEYAIELAGNLLTRANVLQTKEEKKRERQIARMIHDPKGKAFITSLTDGCFRSENPKRVVDYFQYVLKLHGRPKFLTPLEKIGFFVLEYFGGFFPSLAASSLKRVLRTKMADVILPAEEKALTSYLEKRKSEGITVNLNRLGEAILGEAEAKRRLELTLQDLENPLIEVISVKISSIFSQIQLPAEKWTKEQIVDRLKTIFRACKGKKIINLDMEEYRDLYLTASSFQEALDDPEFLNLTAGIALQSYLPDSFAIQVQLTEWAKARSAKGGAPIRIRIVKGANLGMERVDASLKNLHIATFQEKKETDANFKKMVLFGMQKENAECVHLGIGSHNLFDIAFSLICAYEHNVEPFIVIEMLEGMAPHMTRAILNLKQKILLYSPIAELEDFHTATAYLMRRLDENTGQDNFLAHLFNMQKDGPEWARQAEFFRQSAQSALHVADAPKRTQNRFLEQKLTKPHTQFQNDADTDFSLPHNRKWAETIVQDFQNKTFEIPLVIAGKEIFSKKRGIGIDPSRPNFQLHSYSLGDIEDCDKAIDAGLHKEIVWDKYSVFQNLANLLREHRRELIGVMIAETAKPIMEADSEVTEAIDMAEYYSFVLKNETRFGLKSSHKITLVASPWNFPLSIPLSGILAALSSSSSVIFKPAEEAILVGYKLFSLCLQAGIPKERLQFLTMKDEPTGSYLIKHSKIERVILTGATSTARKFLEMKSGLQLFAETGGKNAIIVTAISDHDQAVKDIVQSAFGYAGQKCSACSLLILEEEVYHNEKFLKQLRDATLSLKASSAWNLETKVNPLIRPPSAHLLKALTTVDEGEHFLVEPHVDKENEKLWSPGIKLGVKKGSFMHQTELFGPILGVMCAKNLDEAIDFVNCTPYGLTSGLQSLDPREHKVWCDKIQAGNCYINRGITGAIVARQPFGGCKASSFGSGMKAGGENYILQLFDKAHRDVVPDDYIAKTSLDLSALSPPEEEYVERAVRSYHYWWESYFSKRQELQMLVGEDNTLHFQAHPHIFLFLQKEDRLYDRMLFLAAAKLTGTKVTMTEDSKEFTKHISETPQARIRAFSMPPKELIDSWSKNMSVLDVSTPKTVGRLELLHFVREVSVSYDYHRYGSLPFHNKL